MPSHKETVMIRSIGKMVVLAAFALAIPATFGQGPGGQAINPLVPPGVVRTDVVTVRALTMQYSIEAAQEALDACAVTNPHIAVVVVDSAGNARLIMVADGARASLVEPARRKGLTAATLRRVTSVEQTMVAANPLMVIPPNAQDLIEPGGVPIRAGLQVIGGIGIEGGDPIAAEKCAQAGVDKLKDVLHPETSAPGGSGPNAQSVSAPK
jgi:uncharacterized protein GlcG (DUF336 family)